MMEYDHMESYANIAFNPIQAGLFEGFLTIVRQLKGIAVKEGIFNDH